MQFPGKNKLVLSDEAMCAAIEAALNTSRQDGEDWIYVTKINSRWADEWSIELSTDRPQPVEKAAEPVKSAAKKEAEPAADVAEAA